MGFDEWWGRTFERRGSVSLTDMPDSAVTTLRRLSTEDVAELIRSEENRSTRGILAQAELRRRENWTARFALIVSVAALVASILAIVAERPNPPPASVPPPAAPQSPHQTSSQPQRPGEADPSRDPAAQ
jgi:hypothetical protein